MPDRPYPLTEAYVYCERERMVTYHRVKDIKGRCRALYRCGCGATKTLRDGTRERDVRPLSGPRKFGMQECQIELPRMRPWLA